MQSFCRGPHDRITRRDAHLLDELSSNGLGAAGSARRLLATKGRNTREVWLRNRPYWLGNVTVRYRFSRFKVQERSCVPGSGGMFGRWQGAAFGGGDGISEVEAASCGSQVSEIVVVESLVVSHPSRKD